MIFLNPVCATAGHLRRADPHLVYCHSHEPIVVVGRFPQEVFIGLVAQ